jgi:hypothetical protein
MTKWVVVGCSNCGKLLGESVYTKEYVFDTRDLCKDCAIIRGEDVSKWLD